MWDYYKQEFKYLLEGRKQITITQYRLADWDGERAVRPPPTRDPDVLFEGLTWAEIEEVAKWANSDRKGPPPKVFGKVIPHG